LASASAAARPMPVPAPVMRATLLSAAMSFSPSCCRRASSAPVVDGEDFGAVIAVRAGPCHRDDVHRRAEPGTLHDLVGLGAAGIGAGVSKRGAAQCRMRLARGVQALKALVRVLAAARRRELHVVLPLAGLGAGAEMAERQRIEPAAAFEQQCLAEAV